MRMKDVKITNAKIPSLETNLFFNIFASSFEWICFLYGV